jgi:hypothetical protein
MHLIYGGTTLLFKRKVMETVSNVDMKITLFSIYIVAIICELWTYTLHNDNKTVQSNPTVCSVCLYEQPRDCKY